MQNIIFSLLFALTISACQQPLAPTSQAVIASPQLRIEIINALQNTSIEAALTPEQKQKGLMFRNQLAEQSGMLFVLEQNSKPCFWMKNTLIPLTVGFIDEKGVLLETADMQPQTETPHCSKQDVRYAIEMNQGWFERHHVQLGTPVLKITNNP